MPDGYDDYRDDLENEPLCPVCGSPTEWVDCWDCGGDGEFDEHETDPINYAPDECYRPCDWCGGQGGHYICINVTKHPQDEEADNA